MNRKTTFSSYAAIFLGGCVGTSLRVLVTSLLPSGAHWGNEFLPYGTLLVNLLGAFLLGALGGLLASRFPNADPRIRLFAGTGILGSFTTYGTFISESARGSLPLTYIALSLLGGALCAWLGIVCTSRARRSQTS